MPELPDLLYIQRYLEHAVKGRTVTAVDVFKPVVLRSLQDVPPGAALSGKTILSTAVRGPFLTLSFTGETVCVINLMLSGRLQHQRPGDAALGHRCLALLLDDGSRLTCCDERAMAKVYVGLAVHSVVIPRYHSRGVDVLSPEFTQARFRHLALRARRKQVRVFINDHSTLSAIGNAYADEILFEARIHPKTLVASLDDEAIGRLFDSIGSVLTWGINAVRAAGRPIQDKVRDHMRVRNRRGDPCPRCGTTIRREGVRGRDVYFCPACQPPTRDHFIDWRKRGR
jgi:formamidopyrimidine-DNA glycosylase